MIALFFEPLGEDCHELQKSPNRFKSTPQSSFELELHFEQRGASLFELFLDTTLRAESITEFIPTTFFFV